MCAWVPAGVGEDDEGQKKTRGAVAKAVKASIAKGGSDWVGADKSVTNRFTLNDGWVTLDGGQHVYISGGKMHFGGPPQGGAGGKGEKTRPKGKHGKGAHGKAAHGKHGGGGHGAHGGRGGGGHGHAGHGGGGHGGSGHGGAGWHGAGHSAKSGHGGAAGHAAKAGAGAKHGGGAAQLQAEWEQQKSEMDKVLDQMEQDAEEQRRRQEEIEGKVTGNVEAGWYRALVAFSAVLLNERSGGQFFADCARDEHGHCLPAGGAVVASKKELKAAQAKARQKAAENSQPTAEEIKIANDRMNKEGADDYEMRIRGSSKDRAASRKKLVQEFGDGHHCPCVYCGLKLHDGSGENPALTVTRDKILTARQGGRYKHSNLVPACLGCNKSRGDVPWEKIKWQK